MDQEKELIIVGTGTNARRAYEMVTQDNLFRVAGFSVNAAYLTQDTFLGLPVYPLEQIEQHVDVDRVLFFVALFWNRCNADRRKLYEQLKVRGFRMANIISPHAVIRGTLQGDNCWIHDFAVVESNSFIGSDVVIMAQSLVATNTVIADHCFLSPQCVIGGGSRIGTQSFVGFHCTVLDGTTVGEKCILGAGTLVKRNLPDYSLYKNEVTMHVVSYDADTIEQKLMFSKNVR